MTRAGAAGNRAGLSVGPTTFASAHGSLAIGQRSLGDPSRLYPLYPVLTHGCPATNSPEMQYPLDIDYDYSALDSGLFDQSPLPGLERWAPLLPPLHPGLSLEEGGTPLIEASEVAATLGLPDALLLKDESRNPTWSHKDRLNLCTVSAAVATGARGIAVASSGNHGAAAAAYAARAGLPCIVVTGSGGQPAFLAMLNAFGAEIVVVETARRWPVLERIIAATGFMPMSNLTRFHTGNPFGPEGYKTIAYELFLQLGRRVPGSVVVPTGYGEMLFGIAKGFRELIRLGLAERMPRIFSAEPAARGPLAKAMARNVAAAEVDAHPSAAAGIACTVSSYRGVLALRESAGRALTARELTLGAMRSKLASRGLWQEISGVAALAALADAVEAGATFEPPIVAVLTSTGLKDVVADVTHIPVYDEDALPALLDKHRTP